MRTAVGPGCVPRRMGALFRSTPRAAVWACRGSDQLEERLLRQKTWTAAMRAWLIAARGAVGDRVREEHLVGDQEAQFDKDVCKAVA